MPKVVNRKDGTLTIEKLKPCKTERRNDMQYLLEQMTELERQVQVGREAERSLRILEEQFRDLCKLEIGEEN